MARKGRPEPPMGVLRRLDAVARAVFPGAFSALVIVMAAAPIGVPGLIAAVALPCVFFWSVFRPAAMPPPVVFLLGLLQDLLAFTPLGAGVLTLLLAHGAALRWRGPLARAPFWLGWLGFAAVAAGAVALGWGLQALLSWQLPPSLPALHLLGLTVGLYAPLAWVLTRLHTAMRRAEDALP
ncbi:MAG: rod shape-determining protein MreD [Rubritepida sp.]|jgi:rod shape-determining protein MreD|nr:rod shape-determining protein MreD [Rubritepida sp.]MCU0945557.1 rod shape-determining protein MreD [Rubritepida sp.]